jgi:uncharacterized protein
VIRATVAALAAAALLIVAPGRPGARAQALQAVPPLSARVTDLTGTLDAAQRQALEQRLAAIEQRKGAQVAVLLVPTTQPEPIEDYSIRVVEAWKLGRGEVNGKRVDDGLLLLVAKNDRKVRIEVGYGLEGAVPDALAKRIIAETITPKFRQGDFFGGITAGIDDVARLIDGEALPAPWQSAHAAEGIDLQSVLAGLLAVFVIGLVANAILGRVLGSGVGGLATAGFSLVLGASLAVAAIVALIGFVAFLLLGNSFLRGLQSGSGRDSSGRSVWTSGGWGGGSRGGFGGGGGGFGGGGGGFGGGGASGGW